MTVFQANEQGDASHFTLNTNAYGYNVTDPTTNEQVAEGLQTAQFENMLNEIRNQPMFRLTMDKEAEYYDGNQLDFETLEMLEERNQAPLITNLIKPTIDAVLGMEVKSRTKWKVDPADEKVDGTDQDVADALSVRLHKAETETRADRACSEAFGSQAKVGLGWVEVARESDPFKAPWRVNPVHRREMWWDWRAKNPDLSDARYLIRRQWVDEDVAMAAFPDAGNIIQYLVGGVPTMDLLIGQDTGLARAIEIFRGSSIEQYEYVNAARKRVCLFEVWYKRMLQGHVLKLPNGRTIEFDLQNILHCEAALSGQVQIKAAKFLKVRQAWFVGAYRLADNPTPYNHQKYPYVPFFGFREDRTGIPYGLIRSMVSPQDEVNARKSKMMWLLGARRVKADSDAVKDHNIAAAEVARPDAYIIMNADRRPGSVFEVEDGGNMADQQFKVMQDAKEEINKAAGVYQSMLGDQQSGVTAGIAINSLVEQGTTTLAEINDNYRFARRLVGELLLEMVKEDMQGLQTNVTIEDGAQERVIQLNVPGIDQTTGFPCLTNDVSKANVEVLLDDTSNSPTYRMQQFAQLTEMTKALPPQAQAVIIPFIMDASDLSQRKPMADALRKAMGMQTNPDGSQQDPQVQQLQQQMDQMKQEGLQQIQQLQQALQQAQQQNQQDQQQLHQLQMQVKDKSGELGIKSQELQLKMQEAQNNAGAGAGTSATQSVQAQLDAEKIALEHEKVATELRAKLIEQEMQRESNASAERMKAMEHEISVMQANLDAGKRVYTVKT